MGNDAGHPAVLYALGIDGGDEGRVLVKGAFNNGWEDLAGL